MTVKLASSRNPSCYGPFLIVQACSGSVMPKRLDVSQTSVGFLEGGAGPTAQRQTMTDLPHR